MSETSAKRARKSKLVPRECLEADEDENIVADLLVARKSAKLSAEWTPAVQLEPAKVALKTYGRKNIIKNTKNKIPETTSKIPHSPMKFSVKVEVEECSDDVTFDYSEIDSIDNGTVKTEPDINKDVTNIKIEPKNNVVTTIKTEPEEYNGINIKTEPEDHDIPNIKQENKDILVYQHLSKNTLENRATIPNTNAYIHYTKIPNEGCFVSLEKLLCTVEMVANSSHEKLDRIICNGVKNIIGQVYKQNKEVDPADTKIQNMFKMRRQNYSQMLERPSSYKCYICTQAWQNLYDFREHIKQHEDAIVCIEARNMNLNIIAYEGKKPKPAITPFCYRCYESICPHISKSVKMRCGCPQFLEKYLDNQLRDHENECITKKAQLYNFPLFQCNICNTVFINEFEYSAHLERKHTVRSDQLVFSKPFCDFCLRTHSCKCTTRKMVQCKHCSRTFDSKVQLDFHLDIECNFPSNCFICNETVERKCMMIYHYVKHSDKFIVAYRCRVCDGFLLHRDILLMKKHILQKHDYKSLFEVMIVPKLSVQEKFKSSSVVTPSTVTVVPRNNPVFSSELKISYFKDNNQLEEIRIPYVVPESSNVKPTHEAVDLELQTISQSDSMSTFGNGNLESQPPTSSTGISTASTCPEVPRETVTFVIKQEPLDETEEQNELLFDVDIKEEPDEGLIEVLQIKEEYEEVYEDDIIKLNFDSPMEPPTVVQDDCVYKCGTCMFEGNEEEFNLHRERDCEVTMNYGCTKCMRDFPSLSKYVMHLRWHGYKKFTCPRCKKLFKSRQDLVRHIPYHYKKDFLKIAKAISSEGKEDGKSRNKVFECTQCYKKVTTPYVFQHWESHIECDNVAKAPSIIVKRLLDSRRDLSSTTKKGKLEVGTLVELLDRLQNPEYWAPRQEKGCPICQRTFQRNNDCKRHMIEHLLADAYSEDAPELMCQICGDRFICATHYKKHMRDHACLPVYKCDLCHKAFSDSSNFTKHKKIHSHVAYQCDMCQKKFIAKDALARHIIDHMQTDPVPCTICGKVFQSNTLFNKHYRVQHTPQTYRCIRCGLRFDCMKDKWDHCWLVHNMRKDKADCPLCDMKFRKIQHVKNHMREAHNTSDYTLKLNKSVLNQLDEVHKKFRQMLDKL